MIKKFTIEDKHVNILKYMTYQGININNKLLTYIYHLDNKNMNKISLSKEKINRINKFIEIFKDICKKNNINYLYYILILENLTDNYIRNIFRLFNYKYIRLQNDSKEFNNVKLKNIKFKYNLKDFSLTDNPLNLFVDLLDFLKKKDLNIILFFISCINLFFT